MNRADERAWTIDDVRDARRLLAGMRRRAQKFRDACVPFESFAGWERGQVEVVLMYGLPAACLAN